MSEGPEARAPTAVRPMTQQYNVTRSIRTRSIPNVETDRLLGRLAFIRVHRASLLHDCVQKVDVRVLARECVNLERELTRRGVPFEPVTDGAHLAVDVFAVRDIRPPPSWKERRASEEVGG